MKTCKDLIRDQVWEGTGHYILKGVWDRVRRQAARQIYGQIDDRIGMQITLLIQGRLHEAG